MPDPTVLRFGLIGCGSAAVPVAQALAASALTAQTATYDLAPALARDLAERHGGTAHPTLAALLADPAVDAVYIAVPHHQLAPLAAQALQAGKHALVEKPLALSLAEADSLIALAEARGLALGVNYDLRQSSQARQARALVQGGAIGDLVAVRIQTVIDKSPDYWQVGLSGRWINPWRASRAQAGGGVVLMNSSHQLDIARYVTGLEVTHVSGEIGTLTAAVEVEDTASASLRYHTGAIGSLFAGAHLAGAEQGGEHIELYGREGQLRLPSLYGTDPVQLFLRREWGTPALAAGTWHRLPAAPAAIYQATTDAFARAVQGGQAPSPSGRDARAILAIVLGLYRAAESQAVEVIEQLEVKHEDH
jgi:predicted dehydrogenase